MTACGLCGAPETSNDLAAVRQQLQQILTRAGTRECESRKFCTRRSRWYVEATDEPPPSVRYACQMHLAGCCDELLAVATPS